MDGSNLRSLLTNHGGYFRRHCGTTIRYWGVTSDSWIDFDDRDFDAQEHQRWPYSDGTAPDTKYGAGYTLLPDTVETRFATWHVAVAGRFFDVRTISDTLAGLLHRVESEPENDVAWAATQDCIEEETGISVRLAENRVRDESE